MNSRSDGRITSVIVPWCGDLCFLQTWQIGSLDAALLMESRSQSKTGLERIVDSVLNRRLTRPLPRARLIGLPVCVARIPVAPLSILDEIHSTLNRRLVIIDWSAWKKRKFLWKVYRSTCITAPSTVTRPGFR